MRFYFSLIIFISLTACVQVPEQGIVNTVIQIQTPPAPLTEQSPFGETISIIPIEKVFQLNQLQQQDFLSFYHNKKYSRVYPNHRISRYLKKKLATFGFFTETLTASEGVESEQGNCLSLAILTHALAKLVNVEFSHDLVATPALFRKENGVVLSTQHVKSLLYDPKHDNEEGFFMLIRGRVTIDYFPVDGTQTLRNVREDEFNAMYYQNKSVEAYVKGNNNLSYWYAVAALNQHKNDAQAINMIAILYNKAGLNQHAEAMYQHGIKYSDNKFELLNNYQLYLVKNKRLAEANIISQQLNTYDQPNPFKWVTLGNRLYQQGLYSKAISAYKKALKIADYLHEPYFGIARSEFLKGNLHRAKAAMGQAIKKSSEQQGPSKYETKYDAITKLLEKRSGAN